MTTEGLTSVKTEKAADSSLQQSFFRGAALTFKARKLGDLLRASGLITQEQLNVALLEQKETGAQIGAILISQGVVSATQVYRKLAQQWCLKVSALGLAVVMNTVTPNMARADDIAAKENVVMAQLEVASIPSGVKAIYNQTALPKKEPIFGATEVRSDDLAAFKKWTTAISRFDQQLQTVSAKAPKVMAWKNVLRDAKYMNESAQIAAINDFVNAVNYVEDIDNYKKSDYWATPIEFLTRGGDCEDFAIAKYASLRAIGYKPDQLRITIVKDQVKGIAHAVLVVFANSGTYVLDNQDKKVEHIFNVTRYAPIYSINSKSWWLHKNA